MSAFSHADWTVICDGVSDGQRCPEQARTDDYGVETAADVRRKLRDLGWLVNVPNPVRGSHIRRLDYCPQHKKEKEQANVP